MADKYTPPPGPPPSYPDQAHFDQNRGATNQQPYYNPGPGPQGYYGQPQGYPQQGYTQQGYYPPGGPPPMQQPMYYQQQPMGGPGYYAQDGRPSAGRSATEGCCAACLAALCCLGCLDLIF